MRREYEFPSPWERGMFFLRLQFEPVMQGHAISYDSIHPRGAVVDCPKALAGMVDRLAFAEKGLKKAPDGKTMETAGA